MSLQNEFYAAIEGGKVSPTVLSKPNIKTGGQTYMAKLGDYMFSLDTAAFQELSRNTEYNWVMLPRIGRKPAAQFVGFGEDTIELPGTIYPTFRGGLGQMESMRAIAGTGKPLPLIFAFQRLGQYNGLWCIKSIRETRREFFHNGACRKIEFSITLTAYGEDAGASSEAVVSVTSAAGGVQTTQIAPPALLSAKSLLDVSRMDTIIADIQLYSGLVGTDSILGNIAGTLSGVAGNAIKMVTNAQGMLDSFINGGLEDTVMGILPPFAVAAVNKVNTMGTLINFFTDDAGQEFNVFKYAADPLKAATGKYESKLADARKELVQHNSVIKEVAFKLANSAPDVGLEQADHLVAAASMSNAAKATDQMIFATNETARQVALLGSKINV